MSWRLVYALRRAAGRRQWSELAGITLIFCAMALSVWSIGGGSNGASHPAWSREAPTTWTPLDKINVVALLDRMVSGSAETKVEKKLSRVAVAEQTKSRSVRNAAKAGNGEVGLAASSPGEPLDLAMIPPSEGEDIIEPKPIVVVRFDAFDPVRQASSRLLRRTAYRTFCVRTCDGFYWPVNVAFDQAGLADDNNVCQSSCGGEVRLFHSPVASSSPDSMVDLDGRPYASLVNAFRYRNELIASCKCRSEAWDQASRDRHRSYQQQADASRLATVLKDRDQQQREMLIAIRSDLAPAKPKSKQRARKPKTDAAVAAAAKGKKRQQLQLASEFVTEEIEADQIVTFGTMKSSSARSRKINRQSARQPGVTGLVAMLFLER